MEDKEIIIDHALGICVNIYNTNKPLVLNNNCRKRNTVKAKRMFLYFLKNVMDVKHAHMTDYFVKMNHATSIHHVNKFSFEVLHYSEIKNDYDFFTKEINSFKIYGENYRAKMRMINQINKLMLEINLIENDKGI
mgnify:CR=1 FL=1